MLRVQLISRLARAKQERYFFKSRSDKFASDFTIHNALTLFGFAEMSWKLNSFTEIVCAGTRFKVKNQWNKNKNWKNKPYCAPGWSPYVIIYNPFLRLNFSKEMTRDLFLWGYQNDLTLMLADVNAWQTKFPLSQLVKTNILFINRKINLSMNESDSVKI